MADGTLHPHIIAAVAKAAKLLEKVAVRLQGFLIAFFFDYFCDCLLSLSLLKSEGI